MGMVMSLNPKEAEVLIAAPWQTARVYLIPSTHPLRIISGAAKGLFKERR